MLLILFGSFVMDIPSIVASPFVGFVKVDSMLSVVVFPAPFGPRRPYIEPSSTWIVRLSTAFLLP